MLAKLRQPKLPFIPPTVDEHPDFARHCAQVTALEARRDATRHAITTLEDERRRALNDRCEAQVAALLGEDSDGSRAADGAMQLRDIDAQLTQLRERAAIEDEAVRRVQAREPQIRAAVTKVIQRDVEAVQRELTALLAKQLEPLIPINAALIALKRQHWNAVAGVTAFDELDLAHRGPNPNKLQAWLETARALGVQVDL
jgi:hypothetical protein